MFLTVQKVSCSDTDTKLVRNEQARLAENLTTEATWVAMRSHHLMRSIFQHDAKQYRVAIKELKSWIPKTVSETHILPSTKRTYEPGVIWRRTPESLRDSTPMWGTNGKPSIILLTAKLLDKWIIQWGNAMSEAKAKRIGETLETPPSSSMTSPWPSRTPWQSGSLPED